MISIIDNGILYRNPLPQLRPVHASLPFIQQLSKEEFFCVYRRGTAWASVDGVISKLRSTDKGITWVEESVVWDGSADNRLYSYRGGNLTKLKNGTLLLTSCRFDRSDPNKPIYNPLTEGYLPVDAALFRSSDGGHNWSPPQAVCLPDGEIGNPAGPVIELHDGCWLMPFETWKSYDDTGPAKQRTVAIFSEDKGKTWDYRTPIADGYADGIVYWDSSIITLENGRLFALLWTRDLQADSDSPIHCTISEDGGRTWSKPESIGIIGHTMAVVDIGGKRLVMVYSLRNADRPGIKAVLSEDEGKTWDITHQVVVWDARGQSNVGVSSDERCLADMATYAFGKPQAIQTLDSSILVSFWCTQACITHIRWCSLIVK